MNEQRIQKILKGAGWPAMIMAAIVALASIAYAAFSVGHLFIEFVKITPLEGVLAVVSSVGMAIGLLLVVITTDNQNARGLGAILLIAWVLLVLSMVGLDSFMRAALLSVPDALISIGKIVAAMLPALALAGVIVMAIALHDKTVNKSASGASARYVGFMAKGVGVVASTFASYYFGVSRGIDPILAALCGLLLESSFLWAYLMLKQSRDRHDRFDTGMWSVCVFLFGTFIALVSIETLSALGKISVPIVELFGEVGATLYVSAVGLTILLTIAVHLLTQAVDDVPQPAQAEGVTITKPSLLYRAGMVSARPSLLVDELKRGRDAATKQATTPQLTAGLAADGVLSPEAKAKALAAVMEEAERLKGNTKTSENGTRYSTTVDWTPSPDEDKRLREDFDKQLRKDGTAKK
jgi:hypothetical protein